MPAVKSLIDAAWKNPAVRTNPEWRQDILNLRGKYALADQQPEAAFHFFADALLTSPLPGTALEQAATIGTAGQQRLALCELALWEEQPKAKSSAGISMSRLHDWVLQRQQYWPHEITSLKAALQRDLPPEQQAAVCPARTPTR
jgi:hypothetical protein